MIGAVLGVMRRDLLLAMRRKSDALAPVFFFVVVASLFPLGIGPEPELLRRIGPGVLWVGALLATMLSLARLFASDYDDGTLEQLALSPEPFVALVAGKLAAHWLVTGLPLVVAAPVLALQYGLPADTIAVLVASLALGTPVLSLVGAIGAALTAVCKDLAEQIVRDAEGGSRLIRIRVEGAADEGQAVSLGKAVAASDLWRAAANGGDPNWGRVASALGSVARGLEMSSLEISIGPEIVFSKGEPRGSLDVAAKAMKEPEFVVGCVVGEGPGTAEILSADLSADYVRLNAEGTT